MPSIYRSFKDLLVVQISHKLTKYWAHNCVLCHMALLVGKGLSCLDSCLFSHKSVFGLSTELIAKGLLATLKRFWLLHDVFEWRPLSEWVMKGLTLESLYGGQFVLSLLPPDRNSTSDKNLRVSEPCEPRCEPCELCEPCESRESCEPQYKC